MLMKATAGIQKHQRIKRKTQVAAEDIASAAATAVAQGRDLTGSWTKPLKP